MVPINTRVRIRPSCFTNRCGSRIITAVPKLRHDVKSGGGRSTQSLPAIAPRLSNISTIPHVPKFTSILHRVASAIPSDRTFDVSPVAPLANDSKNAATIVAEVSAAAAA